MHAFTCLCVCFTTYYNHEDTAAPSSFSGNNVYLIFSLYLNSFFISVVLCCFHLTQKRFPPWDFAKITGKSNRTGNTSSPVDRQVSQVFENKTQTMSVCCKLPHFKTRLPDPELLYCTYSIFVHTHRFPEQCKRITDILGVLTFSFSLK